MTNGHDEETYQYGDRVKLNFSSNVYSQSDYSELKDYLMQCFDVVGRYPEPDAHTLECMIAEKLGVKENMVMVTNGANEAIYLIAQLYRGWASIIPPPTFSEYEDACRLHGHIISYDIKDELDVLPKDRIYWICNPNNPTGNALLKSMLNHIVRKYPRYLYVIDQSYADYTLVPMIEPKDMKEVFNLMLIQSLSKKYCIPGLRLGYIVASPIIIGRLKHIRQPWTINALAIEAGKYMISNDIKMIPDLKGYLTEAKRLHAALSAIDGIKVMKTDTNFMLASISKGSALDLKRWLLDNYGILIRDASNIRSLDESYFRITAQRPEENDTLIKAISEYADHINETTE